MFLKSIEVQGFKSFANKLNFDFSSGVTGIVGPNGSGKSNVADAVRWVLGEQSAKQLRGASMQDVIFAGTQNRKPQGFAYVAITFDNSDHALAIDYDEVTVSRRVFRSGESEYCLNGAPCRLRDVNELFYDTGIGKEGYSIIGQGQIDKILSGKPEDRRELFDEAAGIVKFKKRKNTAVKKLEGMQANLLRLSDIISEQERRIGPLERQSEKAREYLKLRDALKEIDMCSFHQEHKVQEEKLEEIAGNLEIIGAQAKVAEEKSEKLKTQYEDISESIEALNKKMGEERQTLTDTQVRLSSMEGEIKVLQEQIKTEKAGEEQVNNRLAAISSEVTEKNAQKQVYISKKGEINILLDKLDDRQTNVQDKISDDEERIADLETQIGTRKDEILDAMNNKASISAKNQHFETLLQQNNMRKSEMASQLIQVRSDEDVQKQAADGLQNEIAGINGEIKELDLQLSSCSDEIRHLGEKLKSDRQTQFHRQREYQVTKTRLESLQNMAERYDGYGNSIRRVMEVKNRYGGIVGVVADLVETKKEYETAIETALGGSIQNIVTEDEDTAKSLIEYLKKNKFGRATFLPLNSIQGAAAFPKKEALNEPGTIGIASTLVKIKGGYPSLAEYLLGRMLVVDTIDHAIAIARKYKHTLRIVTLEGELLNAGGSMTGGAFKNSSNLLGRKRELEELEQSLKRSKTSCDAIRDEIEAKEALLEQKQKEEKDLQTRAQNARVKLTSNKEKLKSVLAKKQEYRAEYERLRAESKKIAEESAKLGQEKAALKEEAKELESQNKTSEKESKKLETKLSREREVIEKHRADLAAVQLEFAQVSQTDEFTMQNILRIAEEIEKLKNEEKELCSQIGSFQKNALEKETQIEAIRVSMDEGSKSVEALKEALAKEEEERSAKTTKQRSFFEKQEEISSELGLLQKDQYRLENQKEKWEEAKERLIQYLWTEYELTPNAVPVPGEDETRPLNVLKKEADGLKKQIRELGPVNVNAIEEYKEVAERYVFMKGQYDDVKSAEESLLKIIEDLDKGMRRQFDEKFKEIRHEFDVVFKELFGGGQGTLELLDADDVLEAGIAINAQPPGKKLQNMMQLSGGEKALTAISLLFAIQNLKPSPFCLLDEIEAALDDSNVGRYAGYLDKLKDKIQFIVITHRRGTMLIADRLYGITMQEKGVSTMVPVNLTDEQD